MHPALVLFCAGLRVKLWYGQTEEKEEARLSATCLGKCQRHELIVRASLGPQHTLLNERPMWLATVGLN
jgi:hypothetical protein